MPRIAAYEHEITAYALERMAEIPGVHLLGPEDARHKGGVVAFTMDGVHPHDVAQILDSSGIAIRAGHHCAMPLHDKYRIPASSRASFYLYNTPQEVDRLVDAVYKVKKMFG
jgi:cysteine desulfurase/selenocysteine lyase